MGTYIVSNLDEIKEPFDALHTRYKPALPRFYDIVEYVWTTLIALGDKDAASRFLKKSFSDPREAWC